MAKIKKKKYDNAELYNFCNASFKEFSRFTKENGCFFSVMNYLFPNSRTKEDLIFDWAREIILDHVDKNDKSGFLFTIRTLGPNYKRHGYMLWQNKISYIAYKWRDEIGFYDKH